jgi:hypothetical protein
MYVYVEVNKKIPKKIPKKFNLFFLDIIHFNSRPFCPPLF